MNGSIIKTISKRLRFTGHYYLFVSILLSVPLGINANPVKAETFVFTVGEWKPFISAELPDYGPQAKIVTEAFEKSGHQVIYKFVSWTRAFESVKRNRVVGSFSWSKTKERMASVEYSRYPLSSSIRRAYYLKSRFPNGLGKVDLDSLIAKNYSFVGIVSYWYDTPLLESGVRYSRIYDPNNAWQMLLAGRADIYISNVNAASSEMVNSLSPSDIEKIGISDETVLEDHLYVVFSKSHPKSKQAQEILNNALKPN